MVQPLVVFKRSTRQVSCRINDEVAILDLDRAIYFGLQGVGVHIWDSLEQPRSVADLCASVQAEFDVSEAACRADVLQILASLEEERLVEKTG
ncbi:MAG: PqqD family protein [Reyranella sp.]|uniref:PqqD family protein n=1 Tax=Reyranella sp. TaxID=1929291 RepID=UPI0012119385|nr:MAG: PqqD family protein [Reyranella sp.]